MKQSSSFRSEQTRQRERESGVCVSARVVREVALCREHASCRMLQIAVSVRVVREVAH